MLRPAEPADAAVIAAITAAGFETYRSFAPPNWSPWVPTAQETLERFGIEGAHSIVAVAGDDIVAVGAHVPARNGRDGPLIAGMGHVTAVFVTEPWWGTGVATEILAWLVDDMHAMGYGEGRLYTPVGQTRARAFYAREGWREVAGPLPAPELGLDIMELRVAL